MWQRFTERAKRVVFFAQEEAGVAGESVIAPEHLLRALLRDEANQGAQILIGMGHTCGRILQQLGNRTEPLEQSPVQEMRLSPSGKRALVFAYEEAQALEHDHVGTEHLLLGLIREETGWAGRVLSGLGVELEQVRDAVRTLSTEERGGSGKLRCVAREARDASAKGPALDLDFDEMVAKYDGKLYGVLLRQTGDPGVAVSLTQQTFAHAYWHYEHFRGDKHVMTWLYQIARNLMRQRGV